MWLVAGENILLHSSYDPEKEAHRFAEKLQVGARVCLYGFGLGYHLDAILDKIGPDGYLYVLSLFDETIYRVMPLPDEQRIVNGFLSGFHCGAKESRQVIVVNDGNRFAQVIILRSDQDAMAKS